LEGIDTYIKKATVEIPAEVSLERKDFK